MAKKRDQIESHVITYKGKEFNIRRGVTVVELGGLNLIVKLDFARQDVRQDVGWSGWLKSQLDGMVDFDPEQAEALAIKAYDDLVALGD